MKRNMALIRRIVVAALALLLAAGSLSAQTAQEKKAREGRLIDARTAMDLGDYRTAEKILTELSRQPDNDAALYYLAVIELGTKRFAAAQEHFARAAAIDPGNFWYRDALAVAYSMDGKDEKTVETYEQLLKDFPDRNDLWFNLVNLYLKLKRNDRALEAMDQIETLYGKNEAVTSTRYDLLMQEYKADEALQVLADYNESNPSPVILTRMGDHVMSQAKDSLARSYYEQALALQPDYSPALLGLAESCRIRRDFPGYFSTLDTFVGNADIPAGYKSQYLGRLLSLVFSQEDAAFLQTFRPQLDSLIGTAVTLHPADSAIVSTAGAYYNSTGRGEKAIEVFGRNKDLHPDSPGARLTWIQTLAYNGRLDDAAAQCDSAIARFPREYAFYELKNAVLYNRQDEDGLLANCQAILDRFGDDRQTKVATLSTIGDILYQRGDDKEAFKYYKKVLKIDPDYAPALNNYAYYLSLKGKQLEKALKMSRKTVEQEPDNPTYLDTIGWILHLMGRSSEAKAYFKHAMLYGGKESATCLAHYAAVLKALGEEDLAKVYRNQAELRSKEGKE